MREPELVFKAQQAAAALERAWERWRVVHGMTADPMPAISSYVGYSLEEPWGQPRVVFGVSAEDAEQLVALLDRHDCIGPVHKTIAAGQGGRELPSEGSGDADRLASVPRQAPSQAADSMAAASQAADFGRGLRFADTAHYGVEHDGPVFRALVAAAGRTAGARIEAPAGSALGAGDAGSAVGVLDADADRGEAVVPDSGRGDGPRSAENGAGPGADGQDAVHGSAETSSASPDDAGAGAQPALQAAEAADTAVGVEPRADAADDQAVPAAETTKDAKIVLDAAPDDAGNGRPDDSPDDPAGDPAGGPGPLAQAASTARVEAEARIRAAMTEAGVAEQSASVEPAIAEPQHADPADSASGENATPETASDETAGDETATDETKPATVQVPAPPQTPAPVGNRESAKKPPIEPPVARSGPVDEPVEAADGDHPHDIASSLSGPESEVDGASGPAIGAFGFGSDLVDSVGSYNEPGRHPDQSQDHASPGHARRSRSARSYSIPRLAKSRRAGVSPGA